MVRAKVQYYVLTPGHKKELVSRRCVAHLPEGLRFQGIKDGSMESLRYIQVLCASDTSQTMDSPSVRASIVCPCCECIRECFVCLSGAEVCGALSN